MLGVFCFAVLSLILGLSHATFPGAPLPLPPAVGPAYQQGNCGTRQYGSCYGPTYNQRTKAFCCNGDPYPCANPNGWACCGARLVDSSRYMCCSKEPVIKGPFAACCETRSIDTRRQICCDGEMHLKMSPFSYCCDTKPYDTRYQVCCGREIVSKSDSIYNLACASGNGVRTQLPPPHTGSSPPGNGFSNGQGPQSPFDRFKPPTPNGSPPLNFNNPPKPNINSGSFSPSNGLSSFLNPASSTVNQQPSLGNPNQPQWPGNTKLAKPAIPQTTQLQVLRDLLKSVPGFNPAG